MRVQQTFLYCLDLVFQNLMLVDLNLKKIHPAEFLERNKYIKPHLVVPDAVKVIESPEQNVLPTLDDVRFKLGTCATKQ